MSDAVAEKAYRSLLWSSEKLNADLLARGHVRTLDGVRIHPDHTVVLSDEDIERIAWRVVALLRSA